MKSCFEVRPFASDTGVDVSGPIGEPSMGVLCRDRTNGGGDRHPERLDVPWFDGTEMRLDVRRGPPDRGQIRRVGRHQPEFRGQRLDRCPRGATPVGTKSIAHPHVAFPELKRQVVPQVGLEAGAVVPAFKGEQRDDALAGRPHRERYVRADGDRRASHPVATARPPISPRHPLIGAELIDGDEATAVGTAGVPSERPLCPLDVGAALLAGVQDLLLARDAEAPPAATDSASAHAKARATHEEAGVLGIGAIVAGALQRQQRSLMGTRQPASRTGTEGAPVPGSPSGTVGSGSHAPSWATRGIARPVRALSPFCSRMRPRSRVAGPSCTVSCDGRPAYVVSDVFGRSSRAARVGRKDLREREARAVFVRELSDGGPVAPRAHLVGAFCAVALILGEA
jgi:hypothetical protein